MTYTIFTGSEGLHFENGSATNSVDDNYQGWSFGDGYCFDEPEGCGYGDGVGDGNCITAGTEYENGPGYGLGTHEE